MKLLVQAVAVSVVALAAGPHRSVAQVGQPRPAAEVGLSVEPLLSMGLVEGANEYLFAGINGGALLADGSVVVSDRAHFRIQKFGPDGEHLWSRGRLAVEALQLRAERAAGLRGIQRRDGRDGR